MSRRKRKDLTQAEVEVEAPVGTVAPAAEEEAPTTDPPSPPAPGETEVAGEVETELERLQREASEMRDLAQRKQAELENYRKRMERERGDLARYAGFELVREILPVLDNLELARSYAVGSSEEQLRDGIAIIHRQLQEILTRMGLSEVESLGKPFDPHVHEAVTQAETLEHPEGTVLEVFQKGYVFKDRLLRPARVSVARAPSAGDDREAASRDESQAVPRSD
jgi:molecular chaperone GrpE